MIKPRPRISQPRIQSSTCKRIWEAALHAKPDCGIVIFTHKKDEDEGGNSHRLMYKPAVDNFFFANHTLLRQSLASHNDLANRPSSARQKMAVLQKFLGPYSGVYKIQATWATLYFTLLTCVAYFVVKQGCTMQPT